MINKNQLAEKMGQAEKRSINKLLRKAPWMGSKSAIVAWYTLAGIAGVGAILLYIFSFNDPASTTTRNKRGAPWRITMWTGLVFLGFGIATTREKKLQENQ